MNEKSKKVQLVKIKTIKKMSIAKRINVLIVEDEPTVAQMLKEYLETVSSVKGQYWFSCIVVGSRQQSNQGVIIPNEQLGGYEGIYAFKNPSRYLVETRNCPPWEHSDYGNEKNKHYDETAEDIQNFHLVLLDVMLPIKDGYFILQEIRELDQNIPVIMLSAKNIKEDREKGFRLGADDYVSKPYSFQELEHRIKNILRRSDRHSGTFTHQQKETQNDKIFNIGGYTFDYVTRTLLKNNEEKEEVRLSYKENELLYLLCKGSGDQIITEQDTIIGVGRGIVERNQILHRIWKDNSYYKSRSMDVYMSKLRRLFVDNPRVEIVTLHGSGYRIVVHSEDKIRGKKEKTTRKTGIQSIKNNPYSTDTSVPIPHGQHSINPNFMSENNVNNFGKFGSGHLNSPLHPKEDK